MADVIQVLEDEAEEGVVRLMDGSNATDNNADGYFDDVKLDDDPFFSDDSSSSPVSDGHACKAVLYATVSSGSSIRVWDLLILIPCLFFLLFLLVRVGHARQKLRNTNSPVCNHIFSLSLN